MIDAFPNPKVQFGELKDAVMRLLDMKEPIVIQKEEAIALQKADEVNSLHSVEKSGIKFLSDIDCRVCIDDEKWLDVHEDKITFFSFRWVNIKWSVITVCTNLYRRLVSSLLDVLRRYIKSC